jgi:hypothetical protein
MTATARRGSRSRRDAYGAFVVYRLVLAAVVLRAIVSGVQDATFSRLEAQLDITRVIVRFEGRRHQAEGFHAHP